MRDTLHIGSAPPEEDCAQVGSPDYHRRARRECRAYIALLRRTIGPEPAGASLAITSNPHDFGDYLAVVCHFDPLFPEAVDYTFRCESEGPSTWDDDARQQLSNPYQERSRHERLD